MTSPRGRLSTVRHAAASAARAGGGDRRVGPLRVRRPGPTCRAAARRALDEEGRTAHVEVRLDDIYAVKQARRDILERLGGIVTTDRMEMNQPLFSALWIEKSRSDHHRADRGGRGAQHRRDADHDGDGEAQGHRHPGLDGRPRAAIMRIFVLQGTVIGAIGTLLGGALGVAPAACSITSALRCRGRLPDRLGAVPPAAADARWCWPWRSLSASWRPCTRAAPPAWIPSRPWLRL